MITHVNANNKLSLSGTMMGRALLIAVVTMMIFGAVLSALYVVYQGVFGV